jgi:hypothetical protein
METKGKRSKVPPIPCLKKPDPPQGISPAAISRYIGQSTRRVVTFLPVVDTPKFNHADQIDALGPVRIDEVKQRGTPSMSRSA